jgi:hypothetical protein
VLIGRFWQNGRQREIVDRLKDLDPNAGDADLLVSRRALSQLDRQPEAQAIVAALKGPNSGAAWKRALATDGTRAFRWATR